MLTSAIEQSRRQIAGRDQQVGKGIALIAGACIAFAINALLF